jgi:hypothetical protein
MEPCRHLRWKGYSDDLEEGEIESAALRNSVPYLCLQTCQPWGVDDGVAAPERCVKGRPCFKAPESTRPRPAVLRSSR